MHAVRRGGSRHALTAQAHQRISVTHTFTEAAAAAGKRRSKKRRKEEERSELKCVLFHMKNSSSSIHAHTVCAMCPTSETVRERDEG